MAGKVKSIFVCNACGYENPKWYGRCPQCGEWDTLEEKAISTEPASIAKLRSGTSKRGTVKQIKDIEADGEHRYKTGVTEFDRVLGGGIVKGSLVLLSGDPGIGKSTILLQVCQHLGKTLKILYVSGEESAHQIKLRADRLKVDSDNLYIMAETDVEVICEHLREESPDLVIIDSIQTVMLTELASSSGSLTQVRESTNYIMRNAKDLNIPVIIVGHDGGSETYVAHKVKSCEQVGFKSTRLSFEADITEEELLACVDKLNNLISKMMYIDNDALKAIGNKGLNGALQQRLAVDFDQSLGLVVGQFLEPRA